MAFTIDWTEPVPGLTEVPSPMLFSVSKAHCGLAVKSNGERMGKLMMGGPRKELRTA